MSKKLVRIADEGNDEEPGLELLLDLAGYPRRQVHVGKHRIKDHYVQVNRDASGRIIGSTEIWHETEYEDLDGDYYG